MKRVTLFDKTFVQYIPQEEIERAISQLAQKVNADHANAVQPPVVLCVLNGAMLFTTQLLKQLNFNCELMTIKLSSWCGGTESTNQVRECMSLSGSVKGRDVIVCEDIIDTGNTIEYLMDLLKKEGAAKVEICSMLLKPEVYRKSFRPDYIAMEIENRFIVGYGLDYKEIGRNLPDIYVLEK